MLGGAAIVGVLLVGHALFFDDGSNGIAATGTASVPTSDPAATLTRRRRRRVPARPPRRSHPCRPRPRRRHDIRTGHARRARQRHPDRSERRPVAAAAVGNRHPARRLHRQRADVRDRDGRRGLLQRRAPATPSPRTIASTRSTAGARSSATAATPSSSASAPRYKPEPPPFPVRPAPGGRSRGGAGGASPILFGCSAS